MVRGLRVTLAAEERQELEALTRAATKTTGKRFLFTRALLLCDRALEAALCRAGPGSRPGAQAAGDATREVIFDTAFEARLIALACSQAPPGPPCTGAGRDLLPAAAVAIATCGTEKRESEVAVTSPRSGTSLPQKARGGGTSPVTGGR